MLTSSITYDPTLTRAFEIAKGIAKEYAHGSWGPAHLLSGLMNNEVGLGIELSMAGIDTAFIKEWAEIRVESYPKFGTIVPDPGPDTKAQAVLEVADMIRLKLGHDQINTLDVFIALSRPEVGFTADQLKSYTVNEARLLEIFSESNIISSQNGNGKPVLNTFTNANLTNSNSSKFVFNRTINTNEKQESIIGRDREINQIFETLNRQKKPNVLLVGDPGVGKTSVIKGFAELVFNNSGIPKWNKKQILEVDMVALLSGASYKGEAEERFTKILEQVKNTNSILIIEDIHEVFEDKSSNSGLKNIIKSELNRGGITLIATTTNDGLKVNIENDKSLLSSFEIIKIVEPDVHTTEQMIKSVSAKLKEFHQLTVTDEIYPEVIRLSKRYLTDRKLPDAAIGLLDQTMAAVRSSADILQTFTTDQNSNKISSISFGAIFKNRFLSETKTDPTNLTNDTIKDWYITKKSDDVNRIYPDDVNVIISQRTGIPLGKMNEDEKAKILNIEAHLKKRVVGQDYAVENISKAIREARSGLNEPGKPIASVFFLGPTGTGKTELAKTLAEFLFDNEKALIRFDMSEFKESHSAALLYGAPPGYVGYEEGGMLVNKIRQQPYAVVLFDEIEKAHSSVFDIFLQIMDDGRLSDKLGKEGDFSNAVILFSSNIGSEYITEYFTDKGQLPPSDELKGIMEKNFRKEFLGRISSIVPFAPIQKSIIPMILDIQLRRLKELAAIQGVTLEVDEEAKNVLSEAGFNPVYGARPLKETVRTYIRQPLSKLLLEGKLVSGNKVTATGINNKIDFIIS